jgi:hypothetical protein
LTVDRDRLAGLAAQAWKLFDESRAVLPECVVNPSMPILYFGDTVSYGRATLKVVTVGLNPSLEEFPTGNPWLRFPGAEPNRSRPSSATYLDSLDEYFRRDHYSWFDRGFGPILRGLGTSYLSGAAIHTDIASPVATTPIWSGLKRRQKALLPNGAALWRAVVDLLAPDLVLISVAREHLSHLGKMDWSRFDPLKRAYYHEVLRGEAEVAGRRIPVFFGRSVNVPFGSISHTEKELLGGEIKESIA